MRSTAIMRVAVSTSFAADRREPLGTLVERVHNAFLEAGQGEPVVQFALSDSAVGGFVSSVDRVLKRFPEMVRFAVTSPASPLGGPLAASVKQIGNHVGSPAAGEAAPFATLLAIATGVPRSFPFHNVTLRFSSPAFGRVPPGPGLESLSMADRQRLFDVRGLVPGIVGRRSMGNTRSAMRRAGNRSSRTWPPSSPSWTALLSRRSRPQPGRPRHGTGRKAEQRQSLETADAAPYCRDD
jgi:hypothetical protein